MLYNTLVGNKSSTCGTRATCARTLYRWAKVAMPFFNEIAHIPMWVYDPRIPDEHGTRDSLVQTIDLAPTILEYFGLPVPPDAGGEPLQDRMLHDTPVRNNAAIYGVHGGQVNVTDGRYVYMRGPCSSDNQPLFEYTLMPMRMTSLFEVEALQDDSWHEFSSLGPVRPTVDT
jgi:arylsulfatase A-like enzyme